MSIYVLDSLPFLLDVYHFTFPKDCSSTCLIVLILPILLDVGSPILISRHISVEQQHYLFTYNVYLTGCKT